MDWKYCCQIKNLPENRGDIYNHNLFMCKITGTGCIASTYEDPDPTSPVSLGSEARYNDALAERTCPAYNTSDDLANQLKRFRLEAKKSELEKQIEQIDFQLK